MRVLIFSDVHGNLPAFEKMLKAEDGIDLYISLGDVVNYGPWSNECVDLLESLHAIRIRGNHEEYIIEGKYPGKSDLVQSFFQASTGHFSRRKEIMNYQAEYSIGKYTCTHTVNNAYLYPDSTVHITGNYFIGHSHYQFEKESAEHHIINVGSVGQNRKEINVINYVLYDLEFNKVELKSLVYDIGAVINKMKELKYPAACIDYYLHKPFRK